MLPHLPDERQNKYSGKPSKRGNGVSMWGGQGAHSLTLANSPSSVAMDRFNFLAFLYSRWACSEGVLPYGMFTVTGAPVTKS